MPKKKDTLTSLRNDIIEHKISSDQRDAERVRHIQSLEDKLHYHNDFVRGLALILDTDEEPNEITAYVRDLANEKSATFTRIKVLKALVEDL